MQINDEHYLFADSRMSRFKNELPYIDTINLSIDYCVLPFDSFGEKAAESAGITVYSGDGGSWFFSRGYGQNICCIKSDADYSRLFGYISREGDRTILREKFMDLLRLAAECHISFHGGLSVHASFISYRSQGVLFTAPSGTGKSTQAKIWLDSLGARIINGDRPSLRCLDGTFQAYGMPWDGKEQIFLQEHYPVKAIVEVRRARSNSLRRLSPDQAFRLMMKQSFIPMWDDTAKFAVVKTLRTLSHTVPFFRIFCLPEENAAILLDKILFKNEHSLIKEVQTDMKLKDGFILKNITDEWIVMPSGQNIKEFEGAIVLNDVSAFIWKLLENPISRDDLLKSVIDEYNVDEYTAGKDLDEFLGKLNNLDILSENMA